MPGAEGGVTRRPIYYGSRGARPSETGWYDEVDTDPYRRLGGSGRGLQAGHSAGFRCRVPVRKHLRTLSGCMRLAGWAKGSGQGIQGAKNRRPVGACKQDETSLGYD
jgi:hypothetical protein